MYCCFLFSSEIHCNSGYIPVKGMFSVLYASMQFLYCVHTRALFMHIFSPDEMEVKNEYIGKQT